MQKLKILIYVFFAIYVSANKSISLENEIVFKINNEIITKVDVEN